MEALAIVFSTLGTVAMPVGAIVAYVSRLSGRISSVETHHAAHEATDTATFKAIETTLRDLKDEQRDQTNKLDRLVERFL